VDSVLRELVDQRQIADLCARYCYALDRTDWGAVRDCFTADPVFIHPGGRVEGADGIVERSRGALRVLDSSQHLLGNVIVQIDSDDPDLASATSYFQAQHVRAGTPGGDTYLIAGSYADRLMRTGAGWRIAERVQTYLWRDGNRAVVAR
jgi:hypothetical protein